MNATTENRTYKTAFYLALLAIAALVSALFYFWWSMGYHQGSPQKGPESSSVAASATPSATEPQLVPVQLTPERMQMIGVRFGKAEYQQVTDEIRATGNVEVDERRLATVQTRFPGWIRQVYANASYQFIRKGEPLFTIYSPDLVTSEQEYLLAKKNAEAMKASSVSGVSTGAQTLLEAARQRLEQWEVPASEIEKLERSGKVITDLTFNSPVSGYITERNALPNMYVQPETRLYTVADLSSVWVYAQVFQNDLARIKPGDPAAVTVDAYPGKTFAGRVSEILPQVDMNTRTARVRLVFPNPGMKLTPGMYVNVSLKVPMGRQLVAPASAVLHAGTRQIVFVSRGEGVLEPRQVETGELLGDKIVIARGLKGGETLVTSANFLIDSESQLQSAAGSFAPPPPGAGSAAAINGPAKSEPSLELTTDPSPPRKGDNLFRVRLTGQNGAPVTGARATITFFMPAMPAMGMAAMKTEVELTEKSNGVYEGRGNLGSGGSWQVTINAQQNGQIIASRHMTVNAEGGM